ncbi:MAG: sugar phosphate isomerase/epimerase [Clostridia bacterium]|nr:sugar phosphate isomerase/epimerase [Clostridia bacterium]MBO5256106.1 sugar phosphate isomerase/epimerase [Clostridia bacterium]
MKIGAMVESFRLGFRGGVEKAASLGIEGLQAYATTGSELAVENMTDEKIRETLDIVKSNGLVFSALCGDFGHGFMNPDDNKIYVEKSKRVLDLAKKLECNVVTTHIGTVPAEECETKEIMRAACRELAEYADSVGAAFAVETGPETGKILGEFLDSLGAGGVRVNFDPANLVMCVDDRPENALKYIGKYVVHTHAKDGIMLKKKVDEAVAIGAEAKEHKAMLEMGRKYLELPLGEGDVNFDVYLPALAGTGYNGFLTIEREVGGNPVADIELAVNFLREKIEKYNLK